jgi:hypothetical protein
MRCFQVLVLRATGTSSSWPETETGPYSLAARTRKDRDVVTNA